MPRYNMINTLKFQLYNGEKTDTAYSFMSENAFGIKCEACIWVIMSLGCYIYSQFTTWMVVPFILAVYNLVLAWIKIPEAQYQVKKKSIKYQIEYNMNLLFYVLDILSRVMKEKGLKDSDVENWKRRYIDNILQNKNIHNINSNIEEAKNHFYKITLMEFPSITEKDIRKFMKKESKAWWDKYYPNFKEDLDKNAFGKQRIKVNNGGQNVGDYVNAANIRLEQNLKILGLPSTVRDIKTVKSRYYELIKKYHPDAPQNKNKDKNEIQEKIIEINGAYQEIEKYLNNTKTII